MDAENNNNVIPLTEVMEDDSPRNKIVVCLDGQDRYWNYDDFGLTFESSESDILGTLRSPIQETFGVDINDDRSGWLYKTRKAVDRQNVYLIPNSTAGINNLLI